VTHSCARTAKTFDERVDFKNGVGACDRTRGKPDVARELTHRWQAVTIGKYADEYLGGQL
jgi:hypothetical protein